MTAPKPDEYSEAETARRRDEALRRALNTLHKPHAPLGKKRRLGKPSPRPRSGQKIDKNRNRPKASG